MEIFLTQENILYKLNTMNYASNTSNTILQISRPAWNKDLQV